MIRCIAAAMVTFVLLVTPVSAEVLTFENRAWLCTKDYNGKKAVDADVLALMMAVDAGGTIYLDGSNQTGLKDGKIQLRSEKGTPSEPVYAVFRCLSDGASAENKPFGPNVDLMKDKCAAKVCTDIVNNMAQDVNLLTVTGIFVNGKVTYRIERRKTADGASSQTTNWIDPKILFQEDSPLVILCEYSEETPQLCTGKGNSQPPLPGVDLIRLRGAVKDLTVKADNLKSAKPASVTYQRDNEADTTTFDINGVLGYHFGDSSGAFDIIPYISYENRSVTGGKGDINTLSPGMLFGYKFGTPEYSLHTRLEASLMADRLYDSSQLKLRVYADPAFNLGQDLEQGLVQGRGILFGSNILFRDKLQFRPDLTLIGDVSHVFDEGTNPALSKANNYYGLGGELSLKLRLYKIKIISDFDLQGGVRYLKLFGDINKHEARRWFGSLNYSPEKFPYFGIALSYSKGEDDNTFKDVDTYNLNFTFRY
jgi:hypothetical protein